MDHYDASRAAFEAWFCFPVAVHLARDGDSYAMMSARKEWHAWQAGGRDARARLAQTDKLPPLEVQSAGQKRVVCIKGLIGPELAGHWHSPDDVRARIAEANREIMDALVTATPDDGKLWSFLRRVLSQGGDIHNDAEGYEQHSARLDAAAAERTTELLTLLAAPKPLVALTDEQIEASSREGVRIWENTTTKDTILPSVGVAMNRFITRAVIAEFCRVNGLAVP